MGRKRFGAKNVKYYFAALLMLKRTKPYNAFQLASAVFMILALVWLTVSAPFVYASQQELVKQHKMADNASSLGGNEEEAGNNLDGNSEQKAPVSGSSFSEEYIHDHHIHDYFFSVALQYHTCENAGTYTAFHGEVLVPPPNAA